jgi:serine/threonine protein phosphatase 1
LPLYLEYKDYKTKDNRYLVVSHCAVADYWEKRFIESELDKFFININYNKTDRFNNKDIFNVYGNNSNEEIIISKYDASLSCSNSQLCALEFPTMKIYIQSNIEV